MTIHVGEIWIMSLKDESRRVRVIGEAGSGWWRCVDLQTGIGFLASERWFVERVSDT